MGTVWQVPKATPSSYGSLEGLPGLSTWLSWP